MSKIYKRSYAQYMQQLDSNFLKYLLIVLFNQRYA